MLDEPKPGDSPSDLSVQALLYASGEMEAAEAAAFEQRLGEDQAAREALCQAVEFATLASGQAPPTPDPAYRDRVRATLRQRRRHMKKLVGQPPTFGPIALWMALGAIAAILMMLVLTHMASMHQHNEPPTHPRPTTAPQSEQPAPMPERVDAHSRLLPPPIFA
ncbi:MAG: hypothetical protein K2R98_13820 [Gemmataceae bacterium]|nr:hypothetical protein [Gemmataceae bacterium]